MSAMAYCILHSSKLLKKAVARSSPVLGWSPRQVQFDANNNISMRCFGVSQYDLIVDKGIVSECCKIDRS